MSDATGLRDRIRLLAPSWMQGGIADRVNYGYGLAADALLQKLYLGMLAHFPTRANPDALTIIGQDRLIGQGLTETPAAYAIRLQRAFDTWQFAGAPRSSLGAILDFLLLLTPEVQMVSSRYDPSTYPPTRLSSQWDTYFAGQPSAPEPTHLYVDTAGGNWDWDSLSQVTGSWGWWGMWIVLFAVAPNNFTDAQTWAWGDATLTWGTIPGSWGLSADHTLVDGIRAIVAQFKGAHAWCRWIIISFDLTLFESGDPAGGGINPDGHFGRWSKIVGGQYVPSRFANARYCDGVL